MNKSVSEPVGGRQVSPRALPPVPGDPGHPVHRIGTPRRFGWTWLTVLTLLGVLIFPFGSIRLLNRYDDPELRWIDTLYRGKEVALARASNDPEPRLVISGGSGALFGIDAALIQRKLGISTINLGTHGSLGMEYHLHRAKRALRPGDKLLISIEYLLFASDAWAPAMAWDMRVTYEKGLLLELGVWRLSRSLYEIPFGDYSRSFRNLYAQWRNPTLFSTLYSATSLSPNGDYTMVPALEAPFRPVALPADVGAINSQGLQQLCTWARSNNIEVFATFPNAWLGHSPVQDERLATVGKVEKALRQLDLKVLGTPLSSAYPREVFGDTHYHLAPVGRRLRTERLIEELRPHLTTAKRVPLTAVGPVIYLMPRLELESHEGNLFAEQAEVDYRWLSDTQGEHAAAITVEQVAEEVRRGTQVLLEDTNEVQPRLAAAGLGAEVVETGQSSLSTWLQRFPNHLLCLTLVGTDQWTAEVPADLPPGVRELLQGSGYRVGLVGTGRYAQVRRLVFHAQHAETRVRAQRELAPGVKSPAHISIVSSHRETGQARGGVLTVNEKECRRGGEGLYIAALDVEQGIVLDARRFVDAATHSTWQMKQVVADPSALQRVQALEPGDLTATGRNAPQVEPLKPGLWQVQFTGDQSVLGLDLTEATHARPGLLALQYRTVKPGNAYARVNTSRGDRILNHPRAVQLDGDGGWHQLWLPFDMDPQTPWAPGDWALVGLESNEPCAVHLRDIKVIWRSEAKP